MWILQRYVSQGSKATDSPQKLEGYLVFLMDFMLRIADFYEMELHIQQELGYVEVFQGNHWNFLGTPNLRHSFMWWSSLLARVFAVPAVPSSNFFVFPLCWCADGLCMSFTFHSLWDVKYLCPYTCVPTVFCNLWHWENPFHERDLTGELPREFEGL